MANPNIDLNDNRPLTLGMEVYASKTILANQGALAKGTVLGTITASGKLKVVAAASSDGSQVARFVLTKDIAASASDITADVLKAGWVNANKLIFGSTDTLTTLNGTTKLSHDDNLKANGIIAVQGSQLDAWDNT